MTKNEHDPNDPVLAREYAPEHGPTFWSDLQVKLPAATASLPRLDANSGATAELTAVPGRRTEELPVVPSMNRSTHQPHPQPLQSHTLRPRWPLAAAAALLVVAGIGFLTMRAADDPATTAEIVAGPVDDTAAVSLDGPDDDTSVSVARDAATAAEGAGESAVAVEVAPTVDTAESRPAEPDPTPEPRQYDSALGAVGQAQHVPFDDSLSKNATFLANWEDRALTWFADIDPDATCVDQHTSEISIVNGSGLVQDLRDPQLRFSGEISTFTVHPEKSLAAWIVSCGNQLEFYTATLADSGQVEKLNLVWLGTGSPRAALILWDGFEASLNAIAPGARAFAIFYNTNTDELTRNDGEPALSAREAGSPAQRSSTPLVASTDGGVSYWVGQAPSTTFSACADRFGDDAETLWLRYGGDGTWVPALDESVLLGSVTAAAIEPSLSQIAFADTCGGQTQRLLLGTLQPDGRIVMVSEVSLVPYVPGPVSDLYWVDAETLRIETDNSEFGTPDIDLDYRLDEGAQEGIIVLID